LHSDVLNSFSWSFNLCGSKEWTFYSPNDGQPLVVKQQAGEAMFVPSTLLHCVVNLEATLSINHNWITTANLDLVWDCLLTEMRAIETELCKWNDECCWQARESMLRGCVGLDVTAFVLMIMYGISQAFLRDDEESKWDIIRMGEMLRKLVNDISLALPERLVASLESSMLGEAAFRLIMLVLERLDL
jgi:hypothetical protein